MKYIVKIICLLLIVLVTFGLFSGCGGSKGNSDTGKADGSFFSTDDVRFIDENGESVYSIIRPENGDSSVSGVVFKALKANIGVVAKNVTDTTDGTDKYEILVGDTNRPETVQVKEYFKTKVKGRWNDYIICTIGKKIVIYGATVDALKSAGQYFADNFAKKDGVKGGIKYIYNTEGNLIDGNINGVSINNFIFVRQRFNESYITTNQLDESIRLIGEKPGFVVEIVEDNVAESEYEIIVGNANRSGVNEITDNDQYSIRISGKKVYLNGKTPSARAMAVSEFANMVTTKDVTDADSRVGSYAETFASYDDSKTYAPIWTDDFDIISSTHETGIDLTKWAFGLDGKIGHNNRYSIRSQDADKLFVCDGKLNFFASYDDQYYYGFKIQTKDVMEFKYGVLEMSAILPDSGSTGSFWIALWCCTHKEKNPAAFSTEVNVVEMFGNSAAFASNLHGWMNVFQKDYYESFWKPQGYTDHWSFDTNEFKNDKRYECPDGKFNDGFHTFSFIWKEDLCGFACDGNMFFSVNPNDREVWKETFNQPLFVILSLANSFSNRETCLTDDAPEWSASNNFLIDYVHIYQKNDGKHQLTYLK